MKSGKSSYGLSVNREVLERQMIDARRRQSGIAFPAPRDQNYALIIRFNISPITDRTQIIDGLNKLCLLMEHIDSGAMVREEKTEEGDSVWSPLSTSNFTSTIGFGKRFFKGQNILEKCPKYLYDMPEHSELLDSYPYTLQQTDMILQLASNDYAVNRLVLQSDSYLQYNNYSKKYKTGSYDSKSLPSDFEGALRGWADISDIHGGFHRTDGKNLMGFYDGISNPDRLGNDYWISKDEDSKYADGTIMVFQKIEHDLRLWEQLTVQAQESWVGRSKATGLLLGTISEEEEKRLQSEIHSADETIREDAINRIARLVEKQRDPKTRFFDPYDARYYKVSKSCPTSSHVRKANPREYQQRKPLGLIFRRGYLYMEEQPLDFPNSGLLFISFQKDIKIFENMKKNLATQIDDQLESRTHSGKTKYNFKVLPKAQFNTKILGGGYYFIPPIPNKRLSDLPSEFFNLRTST